MPVPVETVKRFVTAILFFGLLVSAATAAGATAPGATTAAQFGNTVEFTATITDANGEAVTDTRVEFTQQGQFRASGTTNASGTVTVELTAGEEYAISVTQERQDFPDDGIPDLYTVGTVSPTADTTASYQLPAANDVEVAVVDRSGSPFADVTVDLTAVGPDGANGATLVSLPSTNDAGLVEINGTTTVELAGRVLVQTISFNLDDPYTDNRTVATVEGDTTIEVETVRKSRISGTWTLSNGSAASGTVTFNSGSVGLDGFVFLNDTGAYDAFLFPGREYNVGYEQAGGTTGDGVPDVFAVGTVSIDSDTTRDFTVDEGYETTVTVADAAGDPVSGADVTVTHRAGGIGRSIDGTTDQQGELAVDLTGDVEIEVASTQQYGPASTETTVTGPGSVQLQVPDRVTVTGTVQTADGEPLVGRVSAQSAGTDASFFGPTVDSSVEGSFSVNVTENERHDYVAVQSSDTGYPQDGTADLFEFDARMVSEDTDLGTATAPEGFETTLTVRNESGPIPNASIAVVTRQNDDALAGSIPFLVTNADGVASPLGSDQTTFELNGRYEFQVVTPDGNGLPDRINRTVTIDEPRDLVVGADGSSDAVPDGAVYESGTAAAEYDGDANGEIEASELVDAVDAFASGSLTPAGLVEVVNAFAAS